MRALLLLVSSLALVACGGHRTGGGGAVDLGVGRPDTGAGFDAGVDMPVSFHCVADPDCDDHLFCTGTETCQPGNPAADSLGCVRGPSACAAGLDCSEATHGCTPRIDAGFDAGADAGDAGAPGDVRATIGYVDLDTMVRMRLPPAATASGGTPDTSCFGTPRRPPSTGSTSSLSLTVTDFQLSTGAGSLTVNWYSDDVVPAAHGCGTGCTATTTNASGVVTLSAVSGSWLSYYVGPHTGVDMAHTYLPTIGVHTPASSSESYYAVSQQTLSLIPTLLGLRRATGTALVIATATDCAGEPIAGLVLRAFRSDGTLIEEPPDGTPGASMMPAYRYDGDTGLPSSSQYYTNIDGAAFAVNVPPDTPVRLETWEDDGTAVHLVGCEEVLAMADATSFVPIGPYRSDGPTGCTETRP